jgi:hypothetical protein
MKLRNPLPRLVEVLAALLLAGLVALCWALPRLGLALLTRANWR